MEKISMKMTIAVALMIFQGLKAQVPDTVLTLPAALRIAADNYPRIKAAQSVADASALEVKAAKRDGLPNFTLGIQGAYGTQDGGYGLSNGIPGLTTITGGPITATQNWQAAFGALYLSNIDWNLYSFGLQRARVAAAKGQYEQDRQALAREIFQQQVKVAGAYLSLLAAVHVRMAMEDNLSRTLQLKEVILARTVNGLNPGVDSAIANAEVSSARLSLIDARNYEQVQANNLLTQMGVRPQAIRVDTAASRVLPKDLLDGGAPALENHPDLRLIESEKVLSDLTATSIRKAGMPRLLMFGAGQDRGSGFGPYRANYLVGLGVVWNFTDLGRTRLRAAAQQQRSDAYTHEYEQEQNDLVNQLALSDQQIRNALEKYRETPVQLRAASDAYTQKKALYENGLNNIVDVSQTLYLLNRAEIDRDIACNAVWQALLFKAASRGELDTFLQQF